MPVVNALLTITTAVLAAMLSTRFLNSERSVSSKKTVYNWMFFLIISLAGGIIILNALRAIIGYKAVYLSLGLLIMISGLHIMGFSRLSYLPAKIRPTIRLVQHSMAGQEAGKNRQSGFQGLVTAFLPFYLTILGFLTLSQDSLTDSIGMLVLFHAIWMAMISAQMIYCRNHLFKNESSLRFWEFVEMESGLFLVISGMLIMSGKISGLYEVTNHFLQ